MFKSIKLKKWDYRSENEMVQHREELVKEFRKHYENIVVEETYRFGELDHVFILISDGRVVQYDEK